MVSHWLKSLLPRGLYGRTALILVVPIVTIQIVLSIVFIQRHFDRVTQQLTGAVVLELRYILGRIDAAPELGDALAELDPLTRALRLELAPAPGPVPPADLRRVHDLAGVVLLSTLREDLPGYLAADLQTDTRQVVIWTDTAHGVVQASLNRNRMSPSNPHQLLVIVLLATIVMTFISFLFLRNQVRPIRRLARAAEAFGKGQSLRYYPSGASEVRAAGRAFLDMRDRIERQIEQRTLMLSGVSHDMRTPLTRMRLTLSMMEPGEDVAALEADIAELETLLGSFLDFARAHSVVEVEAVDPVAMVREVVEARREAQPRVTFDCQEAPVAPMALRPLLVVRALENLIGNALRYGASAHVSLTQSDTELTITVEDRGPGIPPERREEAKRPFVRLDSARNQNLGGGVGLGLAIAEDAMHQHGGRLELDNSPALGGLRARLILPR